MPSSPPSSRYLRTLVRRAAASTGQTLPVPTVLPLTVAHTLHPSTFCPTSTAAGTAWAVAPTNRTGDRWEVAGVDGIGFTVAKFVESPTAATESGGGAFTAHNFTSRRAFAHNP